MRGLFQKAKWTVIEEDSRCQSLASTFMCTFAHMCKHIREHIHHTWHTTALKYTKCHFSILLFSIGDQAWEERGADAGLTKVVPRKKSFWITTVLQNCLGKTAKETELRTQCEPKCHRTYHLACWGGSWHSPFWKTYFCAICKAPFP